MKTVFSVSNFIYRTPLRQEQKNKTSQITFKGQNDSAIEQTLKTEIYKLSLLNLSVLNKSNRISFGANLNANEISQKISETLYKYRKQDIIKPCIQNPCPSCCNSIKSKILPFVENNKTIEMLMICFPFKLPSRLKTLGTCPDKAEEISMKNLRGIISEVEKIYKPKEKPGAEFTIYSDNLIFSEAEIHPSDEEARLYLEKLEKLTEKLGVNDRIKFKTIENVEFFDKTDAPKDLLGRREWLRDKYGNEYTEENLKIKMSENAHYNNFVNGIKKFNQEIVKGIFATEGEKAIAKEIDEKLIMNIDEKDYIQFISLDTKKMLDNDDPRIKKAIDIVNIAGHEALSTKFGKSDTPYVRISLCNGSPRFVTTHAGKRKINNMAYKALHLDQSWVSFINDNTKEGVRFSIHPQPCGSFKTGIELVPGNGWIQPWNSVAVDVGNDNYVLTKAIYPKTLGCQLVNDPLTGNPSHYKINSEMPNKENIIENLTKNRNDIRF